MEFQYSENILRSETLLNTFGVLDKEKMEFVFSKLNTFSPNLKNVTPYSSLPITPDSKMAPKILDLIEASDLLFNLRGAEYTINWFKKPRDCFEGLSAFEMCLVGEGAVVMRKIQSEECF